MNPIEWWIYLGVAFIIGSIAMISLFEQFEWKDEPLKINFDIEIIVMFLITVPLPFVLFWPLFSIYLIEEYYDELKERWKND